MGDFVASCLLHGQRPSAVSSQQQYSRPDLITKLLRERDVARFVVAPSGFGKTMLACEYARTVFSFKKTFWIDARDPRFVLHLDDRTLADYLIGNMTGKMLAVFEDVPLLEQQRSECFSEVLASLLDRGMEVLVTCTPLADAYGCLHDRIRLDASDLLVQDAELEALRKSYPRKRDALAAFSSAARLPVMVWGSKEEQEAFLPGLLREELPSDMLLAFFVLLVLRQGSIEDFRRFSFLEGDALRSLECDYLFLGLQEKQGGFRAIDIDMTLIADAFAGKLSSFARVSPCQSLDDLLLQLADVLVRRGDDARACALMQHAASGSAALRWLDKQQDALFDHACILPACRLSKARSSCGGIDGALAARLRLCQGVRFVLLNDADAARREFGALLRSSGASSNLKGLAAAVLHLFSLTEGGLCEDYDAAYTRELLNAVSVRQLRAVRQGQGGEVFCRFDDEGLDDCLAVASAYGHSLEEAVHAWNSHFETGRASALFNFLAVLLLNVGLASGLWKGADTSSEADDQSAGESMGLSEALDRILCLACGAIAGRGSAELTLADALVVLLLEKRYGGTPQHASTFVPSSYVLYALHALHLSLIDQQREYVEEYERENEEIRDFLATHPGMFASRANKEAQKRIRNGSFSLQAEPSAPMLTVNLFGGLDVYVGDKHIEQSSFQRNKAKTLLALLALNKGKEFPRDSLVRLLWPDSDIEHGRNNFYGLWSTLRQLLSVSPGRCPYLVRQQKSLSLNVDLLSTDLVRFERLCRTLSCEAADYSGWDEVCFQLDEHFSDDLLPSMKSNPFIDSMRNSYRKRLVEGLLAASDRLLVAGNARQSIRFAQEALNRDELREDAHLALMRGQLARGQRTAALDTFFTCRDALRERLGMDPSREMMELYYLIITEEDERIVV